MKKTFKILFTLLFCLCPTLILAACGSVNYFTITSSSSSSTLGNVSGTPGSKVSEGTIVNLVAHSNNTENNPLLGWIKDDETLVKIASATDNVLSIEAKNGVDGKYTALFNEPAASMQYAYISNYNTLTVEDADYDASAYTVEVSYAIMSAGSSSYLPFKHDIANQPNVLFFGQAETNREYKFKVKITIPSETDPITLELSSDSIISRETFDDKNSIEIEYNFVLPNEDSGNYTLTFTKFSTDIYQNEV